MISIRKKATAPVPGILQTKGKRETEALKVRFDNGERDFSGKDFDSSIYGNKEVKDALITIQNYKCCFCESKIGHISYGDVEHFRPKAGWVQDDEQMNKPGYYWLAYEWDNLLLSCPLCNQRYKKNFFPLINNHQRSLSHYDNIDDEQPVFIHPAKDEAETYITFKEEIPVAVNGNVRGKETISKLGLDRELLNEQRRNTLNKIRDIYDLASGYPDTYPELQQVARNKVKKYIVESELDETEYASMLRGFFRDNPVHF
ncbi:MAG: hypothetical protein JWQ09_1005 [Segetibacter sp.]|nr:hypothetical protein [Segetibacter sp.]